MADRNIIGVNGDEVGLELGAVLLSMNQPDPYIRPAPNILCGYCHESFENALAREHHVSLHTNANINPLAWEISDALVGLSRRSHFTLLPRIWVDRAYARDSPVFNCFKCLRGFSTLSDLREHKGLPHLPRDQWTCSDLVLAFLSRFPEKTFQHITTPPIRTLQCGSCETERTQFSTYSDWKKGLIIHLTRDHGLGTCHAVLPDLCSFSSHLRAMHHLRLTQNVCLGTPFEDEAGFEGTTFDHSLIIPFQVDLLPTGMGDREPDGEDLGSGSWV